MNEFEMDYGTINDEGELFDDGIIVKKSSDLATLERKFYAEKRNLFASWFESGMVLNSLQLKILCNNVLAFNEEWEAHFNANGYSYVDYEIAPLPFVLSAVKVLKLTFADSTIELETVSSFKNLDSVSDSTLDENISFLLSNELYTSNLSFEMVDYESSIPVKPCTTKVKASRGRRTSDNKYLTQVVSIVDNDSLKYGPLVLSKGEKSLVGGYSFKELMAKSCVLCKSEKDLFEILDKMNMPNSIKIVKNTFEGNKELLSFLSENQSRGKSPVVTINFLGSEYLFWSQISGIDCLKFFDVLHSVVYGEDSTFVIKEVY